MTSFDLGVVQSYWAVFLRGLLVTTGLTATVIVLAGSLAIPIAIARLARPRWLRWPADLFVEVVRATPLILQLIYIYYVLPSAGIRLEPISAAVIGLTVNYSAYMSEVYRSGIQAIARGQWEAAESLGLRRGQTLRLVVLPQAIRIVTPALGNYLIALFKDTALASVVTVQDLMFIGQIIAARNYHYFTVYTVTGLLYFAVGYPSALFVRRLEAWSQQGYGGPPPGTLAAAPPRRKGDVRA